jgi:ubiquinol-cytochrome c reductase cytochrome c subunit
MARLRRRASGALALGVALGAVGAGYAVLAPTSSSADDSTQAVDIRKGQQLYNEGCITCHGRNLQGVRDRGPSLIGVGEAAVYFQVATGRMPAPRQEAQIRRRAPQYSEEEINQIAAYVQANGGGPVVPAGNLRDGDVAEGGELFRLNCASCHNFAGRGGALSAGKEAPNLSEATDKVIYAAMLSGPQNMPVFGDNQITPEQKRSIIAYVQSLKETKDPGGAGIGREGPVPEGLVAWVVGVGGLVLALLWIGSKS